MEVTLIPTGVVKMADVSEAGNYDTEVDASVKLSASSKTVSAFPDGVSAELKLPYAVTTGNLKGTELTIKRENIKMTADVEAMMSSRPQDCMKVEYTQAVDVSKRKVDLKGKFASKDKSVQVEATTKLDSNTKINASYNVKSKVFKGKLTYSYELTTLDATHDFSNNSTQLDITRKLEGKDTLKLTTYSGSKQTSLTYKHDPFKLVLKVPKTADKVSGSISFEKEYLW
jgi:osmotically-inducible protein OsmY